MPTSDKSLWPTEGTRFDISDIDQLTDFLQRQEHRSVDLHNRLTDAEKDILEMSGDLKQLVKIRLGEISGDGNSNDDLLAAVLASRQTSIVQTTVAPPPPAAPADPHDEQWGAGNFTDLGFLGSATLSSDFSKHRDRRHRIAHVSPGGAGPGVICSVTFKTPYTKKPKISLSVYAASGTPLPYGLVVSIISWSNTGYRIGFDGAIPADTVYYDVTVESADSE